MARRNTQNKMHPAQKKMILDFAGVISINQMPTTIKEIDTLIRAFKASEPERYRVAYDVIINKKIPEGNNSALVASKATEIVSSNLQFQESNAIEQLTKTFHKKLADLDKEIRQTALDEIEKAKKQFVTYQAKVGTKKPVKIKGTMPKQFPKLLQLAAQRKNILMVGPAGCGKTYIAERLAEALELEFMSQSCSEGISESAFTGRLLPVGKNGTFEYVTSQFVRIYEEGGVFLLDEFDASDPNVAVFLNQALAGDGFSLELRAEYPWVTKHKDFVCVACSNTFGNGADAQYVGRNQMDAATMDRFKIGTVEMDYDEDVERAIIQSRDEEVYEWGTKIRSAIESNNLRRIMSTRVMQDACDMTTGQGWKISDVANSYFSDWSPEEMRVVNNAIGAR